MKVIRKAAVAFALVSLLGAALPSQTAPPQTNALHVPMMTDNYGVTNIAGQPFSADLEIDRIQTLADGSHIHSAQHLQYYRDGEGRIRQEIYTRQGPYQQGLEELSTVTITDTPTNVHYSLLPRFHTGRQSVIFSQPVSPPTFPQAMSSPVRQPSPLTPKSVFESLGTQTIEGIVAEGNRVNTIWPINSQGNDAVFVTVSEGWRSEETGLKLLDKLSDPRSGVRVQRFTNIVRGEPDPSLFHVPPDYTIKDQQ